MIPEKRAKSEKIDQILKQPLDFPNMHAKAGLVNLGNSCYMNTAIQCLSASPEICKYFLSGVYKEELEFGKHHNIMGGRVAETFSQVIRAIYTNEGSRPIEIGANISGKAPEEGHQGLNPIYDIKKVMSETRGGQDYAGYG